MQDEAHPIEETAHEAPQVSGEGGPLAPHGDGFQGDRESEEVPSFLPKLRFQLTQGRLVRIMRRNREWSQSQLSSRAQLGVETIARVERGDRAASTYTLYKLAVALGVTLDAFMPTGQRNQGKSLGHDRRDVK